MKYCYVLGTFSKLKNIHRIARYRSTSVPSSPVQTFEKNQVKEVSVDKNTIALLERLSLVKTDPVEGVKVLEDSIAFASQ
ncbi:Glutamyl-tRNA(Gln) amidotransferase subunit C, mitochondrial, partial [Operophtera brumata]